MARRRRSVSEVSLFAFQDVMASVIGILFFVVLLVALSIVETPRAPSDHEETDTSLALERRAQEVQAEVARLRQRLMELQSARDSTSDVRRRSAELNALNTKLSAAHEEISQVQRGRTQDEVRLDELENELHRLTAEADALDEALIALKDRARAGPRVSYILDAGPGTPEPWLVELTGRSIRVATHDGTSAVLTFGGADLEARRQGFLSWLRQQDPKQTYTVLLIKPSAVEFASQLAADLEKLGFRVGTDLLPESWQAFE